MRSGFLKRMAFLLGVTAVLNGPFFLQSQGEELLKVESRIRPLRLSRGEEGKVVLKVKLKDGIFISPQPAFIIEFAPSEELVFSKSFYTASDLDIEVLEKDGREFLNFTDSIEIPFTVNLKARRGIHVLEGKIKYFACSNEGSWCFKSSVKFSATYSTRLSIKKK
ncbi:MAG: hypothetical protein WCC06_02770 [Candidatus Aminicenantales bacterium]